ncbi:MAG TPA: transcription elongation factor GreA [Chloroflexi bacterium]|nr:transcription elongation factor GreA [Chloroflexota bacterium]
MNDLKPTLLTEEGLQRLTEELEYLTTVKREEIAERLHAAFEDGQDDDFVENAGLEAARNDQAFLEGRIQELEDILKNYEIIKEPNGADSVRIGSWVTISEEGFDEEERYHLVGPAEANPDESRISNESPLGRALLGAKVGDVVQVNSPNGILEFRILKIE